MANNVDPDETAHLDLHYLQNVYVLVFRDEKVKGDRYAFSVSTSVANRKKDLLY